jgi:hypothetical protein
MKSKYMKPSVIAAIVLGIILVLSLIPPVFFGKAIWPFDVFKSPVIFADRDSSQIINAKKTDSFDKQRDYPNQPSPLCSYGVQTCTSDANCQSPAFCKNGCCTVPVCGDGVKEGWEECEPTDLEGQTCETKGFDLGELTCDSNCQFDTSGCGGWSCTGGEQPFQNMVQLTGHGVTRPDFSGAFWNPARERLYVPYDDGDLYEFSIDFNSKTMTQTGYWTPQGDLEGATFTDYNSDEIFFIEERESTNRIRGWNLTSSSHRFWTIDPSDLQPETSGGSGPEAITYVPDNNGGDGIFYVGTQRSSSLFAFRVDLDTQESYQALGNFSIGFGPQGMHYDREDGVMLVLNNNHNQPPQVRVVKLTNPSNPLAYNILDTYQFSAPGAGVYEEGITTIHTDQGCYLLHLNDDENEVYLHDITDCFMSCGF